MSTSSQGPVEVNENVSTDVRPSPLQQSAQNFMDRLLNHDLRKETIFKILHEEDFEGETCVFRDEDALYTLVPTFDNLENDDLASEEDQKSNTCFCRLDYVDQGSQRLRSMKSNGTIQHYARLGWLVRQDLQTKSRMTTNYILLLNVTTEPPSLWLVYDYLMLDEEKDDSLSRSLRQIYNDYEHTAWYHGRHSLLENGSPQKNIFSSESRSSVTGFLGAPQPFDLAMISEDIRADWEHCVSLGLDRTSMQNCMAHKTFVLGPELRAVPSRPDGYSEG